MADVWSFLLQTLTASGAAVLLLAVKAMLRDKLSPRWQFAVWGVLALVLLFPAGRGGRYVLFNWPLVIETAKSAATGDFGTITQVIAPVPLPPLAAPGGLADWLYLIYALGAAVLLARYVASYVRLRLALKKGRPAQGGRVRAVAEEYGLHICPAVEVDGLPTAFICGVFNPVLALPAGVETDEKVILHELLHLQYKDAAWGLVIAFFRCVHWCNPLLWLCADWAGNDLESLCDQRVLERLEGEARRDYGRILLSMADEKYARAPGTTSSANGGRNIARRIQAIARFKRYPAGMALASVCVALVLAVPLVVGARAQAPVRLDGDNNLVMASARTTWCTTYAGAFDAYAKAMLMGEIPYRAMCAPLSEQNELAEACGGDDYNMGWLWEHSGGLRSWPDAQSGYQIYNVTPVEGGAFEGLLMLVLNYPPDGEALDGSYTWLAVQPLRAEKEGERWVIIPQEDFRAVYAYGWKSMPGSCEELPAVVYTAQAGDFTVRIRRQTVAWVDSYVQSSNGFWSSSTFDGTPKPDGEFDMNSRYATWVDFTGDPADKADYTHLGLSAAPLWEDDERPELQDPGLGWSSGSSNWGESWSSYPLKGDWDEHIPLGGGGGSGDGTMPDRYAADLYLNGELAAELTLLPVEGGAWVDD